MVFPRLGKSQPREFQGLEKYSVTQPGEVELEPAAASVSQTDHAFDHHLSRGVCRGAAAAGGAARRGRRAAQRVGVAGNDAP